MSDFSAPFRVANVDVHRPLGRPGKAGIYNYQPPDPVKLASSFAESSGLFLNPGVEER